MRLFNPCASSEVRQKDRHVGGILQVEAGRLSDRLADGQQVGRQVGTGRQRVHMLFTQVLNLQSFLSSSHLKPQTHWLTCAEKRCLPEASTVWNIMIAVKGTHPHHESTHAKDHAQHIHVISGWVFTRSPRSALCRRFVPGVNKWLDTNNSTGND